MEFKLIENKEPFCGICFLNAGNKKTVCLDENHFNQNKLFFIFTLILFYENNWFHEICRWIWNINKRKNNFLTPFALHWNIQTARKAFIYGLFRNLVRYSNSIEAGGLLDLVTSQVYHLPESHGFCLYVWNIWWLGTDSRWYPEICSQSIFRFPYMEFWYQISVH